MVCKSCRQKLKSGAATIRSKYRNEPDPNIEMLSNALFWNTFSEWNGKLELHFPNESFNSVSSLRFGLLDDSETDGVIYWPFPKSIQTDSHGCVRKCMGACVMTTNDFKKIWQLMMLDYLSMRLCVDFVEIWVWSIDSHTRTHTHTETKTKKMKNQNIYTHKPFGWRKTETQIRTNIWCMSVRKKKLPLVKFWHTCCCYCCCSCCWLFISIIFISHIHTLTHRERDTSRQAGRRAHTRSYIKRASKRDPLFYHLFWFYCRFLKW